MMTDTKTMMWADFLRECAQGHPNDGILLAVAPLLRCALVVSL